MMVTKLTQSQKQTRRRILKISYQGGLSHLGSCLSAVDIIDVIYKYKKKDERFILSNGHAGIALYVVLEKYGLLNNIDVRKVQVHPDRNPEVGIYVSTGSLGHGLPIALGMALASRRKKVYCMVSDGECAEGSIWEALRVGYEQKVDNLKIVVNANGWAAYHLVSLPLLLKKLRGFGYDAVSVNGHNIHELTKALKIETTGRPSVIFARTTVEQFPFLRGQDAHYYLMTEADYKLAIELLR